MTDSYYAYSQGKSPAKTCFLPQGGEESLLDGMGAPEHGIKLRVEEALRTAMESGMRCVTVACVGDARGCRVGRTAGSTEGADEGAVVEAVT